MSEGSVRDAPVRAPRSSGKRWGKILPMTFAREAAPGLPRARYWCLEGQFLGRKASSKGTDAARQPPFSFWIRLAYHSPLPSKQISTEVCTRPPALSALGFRGQETLPSVGAQLPGDVQLHAPSGRAVLVADANAGFRLHELSILPQAKTILNRSIKLSAGHGIIMVCPESIETSVFLKSRQMCRMDLFITQILFPSRKSAN
jgi:hypothetical protein